MKNQVGNQCTYYVIVKDVTIINRDGRVTQGSGPMEVTTDEEVARAHLAGLECIREQLEGSLVSQNETMKECEILFRICEITPEANKKAENLISIFTGKHTEHFKNVQMNGSLLHRSVNK